MQPPDFPTPLGVFRAVQRTTYDDAMANQFSHARAKQGKAISTSSSTAATPGKSRSDSSPQSLQELLLLRAFAGVDDVLARMGREVQDLVREELDQALDDVLTEKTATGWPSSSRMGT